MTTTKGSASEVLLLVVTWTSLVALAWLVVRRDERSLDAPKLARAWPEPSRDSAIIGLALLGAPILAVVAVFVHFARTRRCRPGGLFAGAAWAFVVLGVTVGLAQVVALALGIPVDG